MAKQTIHRAIVSTDFRARGATLKVGGGGGGLTSDSKWGGGGG